jgi:crossover junction endodeoxyribonuclease RuvC
MGIDPGADGALTVLDEKAKIRVQLSFTDKSLIERWRMVRDISSRFNVETVFLEDVHAMPGQGVSSMFKFGRGFGQIEALLIAAGLEVRYVRPSEWAKTVIMANGKSAKARSVATAQKLWPKCSFLATSRSRVPNEGLVDSALIAEYGRRTLIAELNAGF